MHLVLSYCGGSKTLHVLFWNQIGDCSRGEPKDSLFNNYYTEV